MMSSTDIARGDKKVIILAGATSSGKSAASMELAKRIGNVEIVIADSVQVYRHLDIVANKPTSSDLATIPHHLVDISEPRDVLSAGDFCELAAERISDIIARGKLPVIVGGSTMWIKWLINGVPDAPIASEYAKARSVELLQNAHANKDWPAALSILRDANSTMVDKLSANDWYRAHRYLEIAIDLQSKAALSSSAPSAAAAPTASGLSNARKPVLADYDVRSFFLMEEDRELLFHTIDKRCEMMLEMGMIQEVGNLLLEGILVPEAVVWKSIGYRRTIQYLLDPTIEPNDLDAFLLFLSDFAAETRAYARKQHKYYRKDTSLLFVNINRKRSLSSLRDQILPYQQVALEILHWTYDRDRAAYELMIHEQCQAAQFVAKWRKKKSFAPIDVDNKVEFKAICSLIRSEELALDVSTEGKLAKWSQLCQDHGITWPLPNANSKKRSRSPQERIPPFEDDPLLRSAANPKIRAEESTQKMKTYVSHIPTPHTPNSRLHPREEIVPMYSQYVPIADEYRARLRVEKPDLWLQFFPVDGNQATLSDNDS